MVFGFLKKFGFGDSTGDKKNTGGVASGEDAEYIRASVIRVGALFSDYYSFRLPWFQRAYAWREEHAGLLLSDLIREMNSPKQRYSLGQIRIAGAVEPDFVTLIDGQQRLVTLTILFALLRELASDAETKQRADGAIRYMPKVRMPGKTHERRIILQPMLEPFFARYVQEPGSTLTEVDGVGGDFSESERYLLENRNHLRSRLEQDLPDEERRRAFLKFILERCYLLVIAVDDEDDAWSMLGVEEDTGLDFHSSDRSKVSLVAVMPREQQDEATRIWEQCQALVGADSLCRLLGHLRTIKLRRRSTKPLEKDIAQAFHLDKAGLSFLRDELLARTRHYGHLQQLNVGSDHERARVALRLKTLWWLEYQFWVPPALHWLASHGRNSEGTARFFERLERLAWLLRLAGSDPTEQERRFVMVLSDIDRHLSPDDMASLMVDDRLVKAALTNLDSRTFYAKHYAGAILRLLSLRLGSDPGAVNRRSFTIEHVLPRNPKETSSWKADYPTAKVVGDHVNRLGNLLLLSHELNQTLGREGYEVKRSAYWTSGQPLAEALARHHTTWTPDDIMARSAALIQILLDDWQIRR